MKASPETVATVASILTSEPRETTRAARTLPEEPGLYAWWAPATVLPRMSGRSHCDGSARLLYIGRAERLRTRIVGHHLRTSRTSTLRRTLAGLLMDDTGWTTARSGVRRRVVLTRASEAELSAWMARWLTFTACPVSNPDTIEDEVIARLVPPLNVAATPDTPCRRQVIAAREKYEASA